MICYALRWISIPNNKFYKDIKFNGKFKVWSPNNGAFKLWHHGGAIENETFWKGLFKSWESDTGWIWIELCKFSNVIFDIGANTGVYSMVAKTINPKSKLYAFEPSINTYNKLKLNNKINNFDIFCEQIASSNSNGSQLFYDFFYPHQTSASLSSNMYKKRPNFHDKMMEYKVQTMTMANYIKRKKISKIDLIKIDVEMHEPEVIEGFKEYLEVFRPVIIIEVLSINVAEKLNTLFNLKEYFIFNLLGFQSVKKVDEFSPNLPFYNFIIFHKDVESKVRNNTSLFNSIIK